MSLSKTSVGMAQIVAQALGAKGIQLHPVNETPIAVLTDLSTNQLKLDESARAVEGGFDRPELTASLFAGADATAPGTELSPHGVQMDESVQMLSRAIGNTLDLTQNVVNPMIDRVVKKIGEAMDVAVQAASSPLEIIQVRPDPIFDSVYLQESTSRYVNQPRDVQLQSLGVPATDVAVRLSTGHAGMDEQLLDFLGRQGVEFAASVWDRLFNSAPASSMDVFARPSQQNEAVFAYFFAAKGLVEVPDGLNMDLSAWRAYCSAILAAAGASICGGYDERAAQRKFGRLVLACPPEREPVGRITVDGDKYADFLAQGGSPELIFATAYGDRDFTIEKMLAKGEQLKSNWSNVLGMFQNAVAFQRFDAMVSGMKAALTVEINSIPDDKLFGDRATYHERLRDRCSHAKQRDLNDLWHFARKAVCRVLFPHTDAESLLLQIDEQSKIHPEKPTRELALYATIEIVARWLVEQLVPEVHQ
jgi:hypothetical protein